MGFNSMTLKPKTKAEDLLEKLTAFSRDKVLSEFEFIRLFNAARSLIDVDAVQSWHLRGLIYFYANKVDEMDHAFKTALNLSSNNIILCNAIACYMNQACLQAAFNLFIQNVNYFINAKDFDLLIKLHRLALNLYELPTIHRLVKVLEPFKDIEEIEYVLATIDDDVQNIENRFLTRVNLEWKEANQIAILALDTLKTFKLRPNSIVEIDYLDGEVINSLYVFCDVNSILAANDLLFEKVYSNNLLDIWQKLMFIFISSKDEHLEKDVA